jgi:hypothetical protein
MQGRRSSHGIGGPYTNNNPITITNTGQEIESSDNGKRKSGGKNGSPLKKNGAGAAYN